MYTGVAGIVLLLSKFHADRIGGYDLTSSSRFAWAFAFVALLCVSAYGLGLPEVPRTVRSRASTAVVASGVGALAISTVQFFVGDALLPRFVVLGSAILCSPWYFLSSTMAGVGRRGHEQRDRVVVVGPPELGAELAAELAANPEKPASVVAQLPDRGASSRSP